MLMPTGTPVLYQLFISSLTRSNLVRAFHNKLGSSVVVVLTVVNVVHVVDAEVVGKVVGAAVELELVDDLVELVDVDVVEVDVVISLR